MRGRDNTVLIILLLLLAWGGLMWLRDSALSKQFDKLDRMAREAKTDAEFTFALDKMNKLIERHPKLVRGKIAGGGAEPLPGQKL